MANSIKFVSMEEQNVEELTPIMKRAFDEDTRIHLGAGFIALKLKSEEPGGRMLCVEKRDEGSGCEADMSDESCL
ncbi:hypothetical protein [Paenibacillus brevis]|uniref:Uncharacterized protein n=1 Tax=Paenibacillus brevis TaxID=2841508 RepID=A0ABS6FS00_9BACL|nr:hypothetical protein [Paenibacillus brevis]MBU5672739.1 hypothetical protein [Paenibacillus brevis]